MYANKGKEDDEGTWQDPNFPSSSLIPWPPIVMDDSATICSNAVRTCLGACESQTGIRTVQELLGHTDVKATMIYTHVLNEENMA